MNEQHQRHGADAVLLDEWVLLSLRTLVGEKHLGPGDLSILDKLGHFLLLVVEVNADDFQTIIMVALVELLDLRQIGQAAQAPHGPEIDHNHLAPPLLEVEMPSLKSWTGDLEWPAAGRRRGESNGWTFSAAQEATAQQTAQQHARQASQNRPQETPAQQRCPQ